MATEKTDVVIIGVGAAGGIIAAELAKAGMKVIGLERGPRLKTSDFEPHDELRYFERQDLRPNIKTRSGHLAAERQCARQSDAEPEQRQPGRRRHRALRHAVVAHARGRFPRAQQDHRALRRVGDPGRLLAGRLAAELRRDRAVLRPAEYELGVSGKAGNLQGKKIDGGNVFEAPRSREYPLPPLLVDQSAILFEAGAKKLGLHPFSSPRAIASVPYKDRPGCTYCGFCQAFGCHVGAKSSILVTKLPEADATGNFKLLTGAMCYRVNSDNSRQGDGRVVLRPGPHRQHDRSRHRHRGAVHLRQYAADAVVEDREIPRTGWPIPAGTSASTSWRT